MSDPGRLAELLSAAKIENELDKKHWEGVRDQYRVRDSIFINSSFSRYLEF